MHHSLFIQYWSLCLSSSEINNKLSHSSIELVWCFNGLICINVSLVRASVLLSHASKIHTTAILYGHFFYSQTFHSHEPLIQATAVFLPCMAFCQVDHAPTFWLSTSLISNRVPGTTRGTLLFGNLKGSMSLRVFPLLIDESVCLQYCFRASIIF